jgi:hypothetical protein
VGGILVAYLLFSTFTALLALRWRRRREDRALQKLSNARAAHAINVRR